MKIKRHLFGNEQPQKDFYLFVEDLSNMFIKVDPHLTKKQNKSYHSAISCQQVMKDYFFYSEK